MRKLPTHRAKGLGRLILKSTFLPPLSNVGTAAMWRAANDKAQTRFHICDVRVSTLECVCSATHPSRSTKPKIRILGVVVREGCVVLHYSVHFFTIFLFHPTIVIEGEGIGARSVRFSHFLCLPDPLEKMRDSSSGPCVCMTLSLPLNHIDRKSVV